MVTGASVNPACAVSTDGWGGGVYLEPIFISVDEFSGDMCDERTWAAEMLASRERRRENVAARQPSLAASNCAGVSVFARLPLISLRLAASAAPANRLSSV